MSEDDADADDGSERVTDDPDRVAADQAVGDEANGDQADDDAQDPTADEDGHWLTDDAGDSVDSEPQAPGDGESPTPTDDEDGHWLTGDEGRDPTDGEGHDFTGDEARGAAGDEAQDEIADESRRPTEDGVPDDERIPLSDLRRRIQAGEVGDRDVDDGSAPAEDAPLSDLAESVAGDDADATDADAESLFEEADIADVDSEAVWEAVVEGEEPAGTAGESGVRGTPEETVGEAEHVVDKREFCQRCEYFSAPPEATCGHEGTDIVEVVDSDSFRVRNCPMVVEDEDGEGLTMRTDGERS